MSARVFKVIVGSYDDKSYYIVRGAKSEDEVMKWLEAWYEEHYADGWKWWQHEPIEIEEIVIPRKGVIQL